MFLLCLTTALLGGLIAGARLLSYDSDEVGLGMAVTAGAVWFISLHVAAWVHRRAVARHEQKQLSFGLLARGADAETARQELERQREAWSAAWLPMPERGLIVNLLWYVLSLLALPALFGAPLRLHVRREGDERSLHRADRKA